MLELVSGLSPHELAAVAKLEARTVEADGGRLKLEWGVLNTRTGRHVEDILWWDGGQLLGFLGLYAFGSPIELAGMVDPVARRRGVATALLNAALPLCRERGYHVALLVTPRTSVAGKRFALHCGAQLEHSEHALVLDKTPTEGPVDPGLSIRYASAADAVEVSRLLTTAFGAPAPEVTERLTTDAARTLLVERDGAAIGTLRLTRDNDAAGVYGFAIDPAWQGRGVGRDVLRRVCRQLSEDGIRRIGLEVAVDNDRALGLYTSLGFTAVTIEDYYSLPLPD